MNENQRNLSLDQAFLLSIQEAAKQNNAIVPILQAAYLGVVSMSDLKKVIWQNWYQNWWLVLLFALPAVLWLGSLFLSARMFIPLEFGREVGERSRHELLMKKKYRLLRYSHYLLGSGLLILVINMIVYFLAIPIPPSQTKP